MLNSVEIREIADIANKKINFPILKEGGERAIFCGIIVILDEIIEQELSINLDELFSNLSEGVTQTEKQSLVAQLTAVINAKLDVPLMSELTEALLIDTTLNYIVDLGVSKIKEKLATTV